MNAATFQNAVTIGIRIENPPTIKQTPTQISTFASKRFKVYASAAGNAAPQKMQYRSSGPG